ncbi:MAG: putative toxin-antitoxin system toxin component, PIN family [Terracidiphilus sp.]|jgi:putative PIN family toxin of toxin-antitoxin system
MLNLRLVIDTNVVVSAALKPQGLERVALIIAVTKPARLYVSDPILDEYSEVLARSILYIRKGIRAQIFQMIRNRSFLVSPQRTLDVTSDPGDNVFLECAEAARSDYLITGNRRHFPRFWRSTKVVSSREFIEIAAPHFLPQ